MRTVNLLLSSLFLSGLLALAQQPDAPVQPPPLSTPPTFPQGQPDSHPANMPPDTPAPAPQSAPAGPHSTSRTVEGCHGGTAGNYVLTDNSGATLQLQGDAAQLAKHVGKRVRITGTPTAKSGEVSEQDSRTETSNSMLVASIESVAESCTASQSQQEQRPHSEHLP
jgi:hypothetical protein